MKRGLIPTIGVMLAALLPVTPVHADDAVGTAVCGVLPAGTTTWSAAAGPYIVCDAGVTVTTGSSLDLQGDANSSLSVQGGAIDIEGGSATGDNVSFGLYDGNDPGYFDGFTLATNASTPPSTPSVLNLSAVFFNTPNAAAAVTAGGDAQASVANSSFDQYAAVDLSGDATAQLTHDFIGGNSQASPLSFAGNSTAVLREVMLGGGGSFAERTPAIDIRDSASFDADCLSMADASGGVRTNSTTIAKMVESDLFSLRKDSGWGASEFEIFGGGKVDAERSAWSDQTPQYGPAEGQVQHPSLVDSAHPAADASPTTSMVVRGPVNHREGVSGAGTYTVTMTSDRALDETQPVHITLQRQGQIARDLPTTWLNRRTVQATFVAVPKTLRSGWQTLTEEGGVACTEIFGAGPSDEIVHIDDHPITPALAALHAVSSARLSWTQRGEQPGTTYALRTGVKRGRQIRWSISPHNRRLTSHRLVVHGPPRQTRCYQVRATAFKTTSKWSRRRCVRW